VTRRELAAYHEAGHFVLAHVLGLEVGQVSITTDLENQKGGYKELFLTPVPVPAFIEQPDGSFRVNKTGMRSRPALMAQYRKQAIMLYGGVQAALRALGHAPWDGTSSALDGLHGDTARIDQKWIGKRAMDAFHLVAEHWAKIEALAVALRRSETLNRQEALSAVRRRR
jgi:hypothetical protein